MPVTLEIPDSLVRYSEGRTKVSLEGTRLDDVLSALWRQFPDLKPRIVNEAGDVHPYLLVTANGVPLPRRGLGAVAVAEGDSVEIVALAEGG